MKTKNKAIYYALFAALCYGISSPLSKFLLSELSPTFLVALLYLGAGIGMLFIYLFQNQSQKEASLTKKELPYVVAMVLLDIVAPILLMFGLKLSSPATVSLLNNFEIVATVLIAMMIFKEAIGKRMWLAIGLITLASVLLSIEDSRSFNVSLGALLVILASLCWGLENNCTRMLSLKDPLQIVIIKGLGSGLGSLLITFFIKGFSQNLFYIFLALLLGFVAYGLSILFYIKAQRDLGAARTSAYYSFAPFIGVILSILIFKQSLTWMFTLALMLMVLGAYLSATEKHIHEHSHKYKIHDHRHSHNDDHHDHFHENDVSLNEEHSHKHEHPKTVHGHSHSPDLHHKHSHEND